MFDRSVIISRGGFVILCLIFPALCTFEQIITKDQPTDINSNSSTPPFPINALTIQPVLVMESCPAFEYEPKRFFEFNTPTAHLFLYLHNSKRVDMHS
ncbi:unnamed protein product [Bemisia tabaci]|uniref:Uncharacterized protein n=1 Tax=Bemisia tabaci TaxID=7038 RepID=A0A9P0F555_BEMTA|nr:unnamed protein product [Bemisia tabaci]